MTKKVITSGDVAKLASVSQSAVSRAFTPGASVAPETRERIVKAATELGYRPNALARAMISGRSKIVALIVAYMDNQFYPAVVDSISRQLQNKGYNVMLFISDPGRQDLLVQKMMQYQVEGIIMASSTLSSIIAKECALTGIPVVLFNRYVPSSPASSVTSDNLLGGGLVADHLIKCGHERIAFIAGDEDSSTNRDREAGFYHAMAAQGRAVFSRTVGGYRFKRAAQATREMFMRDGRPDAVFVANDHMAFASMDVLREELQLRIPEDVSVVGFDDVPGASWGGYNLTTVAQNLTHMVDSTLSILLEQIDNQAVVKRAAVLPVELIVRGTTRLPETSA